ncbi:hypothetical protein D3C77_34560 [compost metagenome]
MSRVSFRSRCDAGSKKTRNRRASVEAIPDAHDPRVLISVLESFDDFPVEMQHPGGPVTLTLSAAEGFARAILQAVEDCKAGH